MTIYSTGNPIGSIDPRDLLDNAQNLDEAMNTGNTTFQDRFGNERVSWAGAIKVGIISETYGAGIEVTARNHGILSGGDVWVPAASTTLPYTTTGTGMPEGGAFELYQTLRQELADTGGAKLVSSVSFKPFDSVAEMQSATWIEVGQVHRTLGYYTPGDGGGNDYEIVADGTGTDDGGSFINLIGSGFQAKGLFVDGVVNIKQFAAVGDGFASDSAAISAASTFVGAGNLEFPDGEYLLSETLIQPQSQSWIGTGGQRASSLKKGFNGDMVILGSLGEMSNLNLKCEGGTFSGRGVYVSSGFSIKIDRVRVEMSEDVSLEFSAGVGGGSTITNFEAATTNPTVVPAIKIQDSASPSPKFFNNIWLSGGLFDISGGGNGSSLTNFYIRNFVTSAPNYPSYSGASVLFHASNGRVASITDTTTISGADNTFTNIAFSGPVYLEKSQGNKLNNCTFGAGVLEDSTTSRYNDWSDQRKSFAVSWFQSSGTQPSIGNGQLSMSYQREGYSCNVSLRMVIGSTTTLGNNSTAWMFSLPFSGHESFDQFGFVARIYNPNGTGLDKDVFVSGSIGANASTISFSSQGQSVRPGFPVPWVEGSVLEIGFSYMVK